MVDWNDYEANTDEEEDIGGWEEPGEKYLRGIYAHMRLGDFLDGRYRIVHKLGWGGLSTVWMARDEQTGCDVALKIMIECDVAENEYQIQTWMKENVSNLAGLVLYERTFFFEGDMGQTFRVLVMPVVGPNLSSALKDRPIAARRSAARQVLQLMARLHAAGIVMNDLNSGSVMWEMKSLAHCNLETKYQILGRPAKTWAPWDQSRHQRSGDIVRSIKVPESQLEETVHLGDFGMAFPVGQRRNPVKHPMTSCAPERLHGASPSPASDMWSYMCIFSQLFFGRHLFTQGLTPFMLMKRLYSSFGPLPSEWQGYYTAGGDIANSLYGPSHGYPPGFYSTIAHNLPSQIGPEERFHLERVLSKGFQYDPAKRLTAAQLLEDPSFIALTSTA